MKDKKNNTWLFLGPEIGEKEAAVNELRKTLSPDGQMEETVYYAGETPVSVMVTAMLNGSLFADKRLFFIKCAEGLKKEEAALLSSYIASPADDTFLVLISEETSIARELENHIPQSNRRVFWELSDSRKSAWVQTFFRQEGFKISPEGVETILELVENNTAALKQECSRLILFLARSQDRGSSEITGEEAERWLSHTREESAFTLFSRIAAGDFSRCLESARVLIAAKVSPVVIFAGLASCFKKLISYLALTGAGVTDEQEFRKIGVYAAGAKRDYGAAGRRY
ncbi:MAG: DNA polymerase III subunit delta, partial [Treponema sp.]|nr:DNA polymerase III subunit delta [Treponema sp.]